MNTFRKGDLISLSDQFFILLTTIILLVAVYFILKKLQPYILRNMIPRANQRIKLIESQSLPRLGQVFILAIDQKEFLVVQNKTGISVSPLENIIATEIQKPNSSSS